MLKAQPFPMIAENRTIILDVESRLSIEVLEGNYISFIKEGDMSSCMNVNPMEMVCSMTGGQ